VATATATATALATALANVSANVSAIVATLAIVTAIAISERSEASYVCQPQQRSPSSDIGSLKYSAETAAAAATC